MMDGEQMENCRKTLMTTNLGRERQPSLLHNIIRNLRQEAQGAKGPRQQSADGGGSGHVQGSQGPALTPNVRTDLGAVQ